MSRITSTGLTVCAALCLLGVSAGAVAQHYPGKPIRLVVGAAPGGNLDITARLAAQQLTVALGQPVVVDNRGGAGGTIGTVLVAKSAPDGYTLLVASSSLTIDAAINKSPPYDPIRDFSPVSTLTYGPHFVAVNAAMPVSSVKELIALARAKPGSINFGAAGSFTRLEGEFFKSAAGIDMTFIPYKGTNPAFIDLMTGNVQLVFSSTVATLPFVKTGKVKVIAVTGSKRLAAFPEIPTVSESGLPQFIVHSILGMLTPARTPRDIVDRLSAECAKFLKSPEIRNALEAQGGEARGSTPQEYAAIIAEEIARWKKVGAIAGMTSQ